MMTSAQFLQSIAQQYHNFVADMGGQEHWDLGPLDVKDMRVLELALLFAVKQADVYGNIGSDYSYSDIAIGGEVSPQEQDTLVTLWQQANPSVDYNVPNEDYASDVNKKDVKND